MTRMKFHTICELLRYYDAMKRASWLEGCGSSTDEVKIVKFPRKFHEVDTQGSLLPNCAKITIYKSILLNIEVYILNIALKLLWEVSSHTSLNGKLSLVS